MDMYAETVAKKLNVKKWYANTTLHWQDNQLADMDYELNQSAKKLEQFLVFCTTYGYKPEECITVGDGENDLGLFGASRRGVLVGIDPMLDLQRHAWKVIPAIKDLTALLASIE